MSSENDGKYHGYNMNFFFTFRMLDVLVEQGLVFMCSEAAGAKNILTEASTVGGRVVFEFCYIYAVIF